MVATPSGKPKEENVSIRLLLTEPNAAERPHIVRTQYLTFGCDMMVGTGVFKRAISEEKRAHSQLQCADERK